MARDLPISLDLIGQVSNKPDLLLAKRENE